jgi:NTE family protein
MGEGSKKFLAVYLNMLQGKKKNKVALVLASGGARGLAHIGVIRELEKSGFIITSLAGSSVGALIGGLYLAGTLDEFAEWICGLDQIDVFDLMDFTLSAQGFIKGDRLFAELRKFLPAENIEDLPAPFAAVAADLASRKEVVFTRGSLIRAIRASVAIPTLVTPVFDGDRILVDGGIVKPIPADIVARTRGDILCVSDINANKPYVKPDTIPRKPKDHPYSIKRSIYQYVKYNTNFFTDESHPRSRPGYLDVMDTTFDIMQDSISVLTKQHFHPDITVEISRDSASTFEFHRGDELIEAGQRACREAIDTYSGTH